MFMEIPKAAKAEKHHTRLTHHGRTKHQTQRTGSCSASHSSPAEKRPFPQPHRLVQVGRHSEQTGADNLFNYLKLFNFKAITVITQVLPRCSPPVRVFEGSQEKTLSCLPPSRAS